MRRATSGASLPLAKQLSPVLSVAAREGPYAFKFEGLTLWLAKPPRLKLFGAFRRTDTRRLTCAVLEDVAAAPPPAQTAPKLENDREIPSRCGDIVARAGHQKRRHQSDHRRHEPELPALPSACYFTL